MRVYFVREGDRVLLKLTITRTDEPVWFELCGCPENEAMKEMVRYSLFEQFGDNVEAIRKEAYDQGWADKASRKRKKLTHFFRSFYRIGAGVGC